MGFIVEKFNRSWGGNFEIYNERKLLVFLGWWDKEGEGVIGVGLGIFRRSWYYGGFNRIVVRVMEAMQGEEVVGVGDQQGQRRVGRNSLIFFFFRVSFLFNWLYQLEVWEMQFAGVGFCGMQNGGGEGLREKLRFVYVYNYYGQL